MMLWLHFNSVSSWVRTFSLCLILVCIVERASFSTLAQIVYQLSMCPVLDVLMRLVFLLSCCICSGGYGFLLHNTAATSNRNSALHMSLGDPDLGNKWNQLRDIVQPLARSVDAALYNDPDMPGLTFPTPIIWAPW